MGSAFSSRGLGIFKVYPLSLSRTLVVLFALSSIWGLKAQAQGSVAGTDPCDVSISVNCTSLPVNCAIDIVLPFYDATGAQAGVCSFKINFCCITCLGENPKLGVSSITSNGNCLGNGYNPSIHRFSARDFSKAIDDAIRNSVSLGCIPCFPTSEIPPCSTGTTKRLIVEKSPCWRFSSSQMNFLPCTSEMLCVKTYDFCYDVNGNLKATIDISQGQAAICPPDDFFPLDGMCVMECY